MSIFILRETCKFDRTQRYVDIYHGKNPDLGRSGDQTVNLPAAEAAALVWKMNPERLPLFARREFGYEPAADENQLELSLEESLAAHSPAGAVMVMH